MGSWVVVCGACGVRIRTLKPERTRARTCPRCGASLVAAALRHLEPGPEPIRPAVAAPAAAGWGLAAGASLAALLGVGLAWFLVGPRGEGRVAGPPRPIAPKAVLARPEPKVRTSLAVGPNRPSARQLLPRIDPRPIADRPAPQPASNTKKPPAPPEPPATEAAPPEGSKPPPLPPTPAGAPDPGPRRVRVVDEDGRVLVARAYGGPGTRVVLLPDGRLGWPNAMVYTDEPFEPVGADSIREALLAGPFRGFEARRTAHYLIVSDCSPRFAEASGRLLESLYEGLLDGFRKRGLPVHEAEFPLVAVIFGTEAAFRRHKDVPPEIQAYYEIVSNRIFFYEARAEGREAPELAARRRPQTVAHEGTHQVLQNIGIQPRLARWPLWLVEGLAEYCAPTSTNRGTWAGTGKVNPFHMATLHDLQDPAALQLSAAGAARALLELGPGRSLVESIVTREHLSPTDYALAWALTHYLVRRRRDDFLEYLRAAGRMVPLAPRTAADDLRDFRAAFGPDLRRLDRQVFKHLASLKHYEALPYYAVTFEQPIGHGAIRRGALVSQSPQIIRQWLEEIAAPRGGPYVWAAYPFDGRAAAFRAAEDWFGRGH